MTWRLALFRISLRTQQARIHLDQVCCVLVCCGISSYFGTPSTHQLPKFSHRDVVDCFVFFPIFFFTFCTNIFASSQYLLAMERGHTAQLHTYRQTDRFRISVYGIPYRVTLLCHSITTRTCKVPMAAAYYSPAAAAAISELWISRIKTEKKYRRRVLLLLLLPLPAMKKREMTI